MGGCITNERKDKQDQSRVNMEVTNSTNPNKSNIISCPPRLNRDQSAI